MNIREAIQQQRDPFGKGLFCRVVRSRITRLLAEARNEFAHIGFQDIRPFFFGAQRAFEGRCLYIEVSPLAGNTFVIRLRRCKVRF